MNPTPGVRSAHRRYGRCGAITLLAVALVCSVATASPAAAVAGFGDVALDRFYTDAVQWMVDEEITTGTSTTCFSPDDPVTRGQGAAFMWRMEGRPTPAGPHGFTDVTKDWQQEPVAWMVENDITTGTSATTFTPERPMTRGELAAFLWRLAGRPAGSPPHPFGDVVKDWQQEPVAWMSANGITTGTSATTFSPDDTLTRGQAATFFHRYNGEPVVGVDYTHPATPSPCAPVAGPSATPVLTPSRTIPTRPFAGTSTDLFDSEGAAYVPRDDSLWLVDDNATDTVLHEIAPDGTLKRSISIATLGSAPRFGGGAAAGEDRAKDLEALAYDQANDVLYVFSGTTEGAPVSPTAFRLTRVNGVLEVTDHQPMAEGADSAAALPDGSLFIVQNDKTTPDDIHPYDYATNTVGTAFSVPGVRGGIWGMGFATVDSRVKLYIGNDVTTLYRVDWATMEIDPGQRFSLAGQIGEPTAVELIGGELFITDGDDMLADPDNPLKYAIHVYTPGTV